MCAHPAEIFNVLFTCYKEKMFIRISILRVHHFAIQCLNISVTNVNLCTSWSQTKGQEIKGKNIYSVCICLYGALESALAFRIVRNRFEPIESRNMEGLATRLCNFLLGIEWPRGERIFIQYFQNGDHVIFFQCSVKNQLNEIWNDGEGKGKKFIEIYAISIPWMARKLDSFSTQRWSIHSILLFPPFFFLFF